MTVCRSGRSFLYQCLLINLLTVLSLWMGASGKVGAEGLDNAPSPDVSGEWDIEEEDKSYKAVLDKHGNGHYSWQGGRIDTITIDDRKWLGTWRQTGNDREGGFEVLLSEDGREAKGVWWYTRVGDRKNIPPREWGGKYVWKRLTTPDPGHSRDSDGSRR
jgi:hypothetical protein